MNQKLKRLLLRETAASYTVEAALVVPMVCLLLVSVILTAYSLHDKAAAENALIRAAEFYSYRDAGGERAETYRGEAERQDIYLSGKQGAVSLETEAVNPLNRDWAEGKFSASVTVDGETVSYENRHLHPETLMRVLTLTDAFRGEKKKTSDTETEKGGSGK